MGQVLDPALVKAGKLVPKPGDVVSGYAYVAGDPRTNTSYKPLEGKDYLATLPHDRQAMVRELLIGKMKWPTLSRNNPWAQQLLSDAAIVDPNFDQNVYKLRSDTYHDFANGPTSKTIAALNQAPLHAKTLADAYDQLHNYPVGGSIGHFINDAANTGSALWNTDTQAAQGSFNEARPAVADELATLFKGSAGTIPGIASQESAFASGAPPAESNNALKTAAELMRSRLMTIRAKWHNAMGPLADQFPVISPEAEGALNDLYGRYHPKPQNAAPTAPAGWSIKPVP